MIGKEIIELSLDQIMPNRFQPREIFDEQALNELALSIREHGVIQPITVRKVGEKYEIIAGERRYRASQLAGITTIPAIVRDLDDKEAAKIALLENLQRQDLTPIEEAKTYQTILKLENITQEELANNLGKAQSTVANKLRLLNLDEEVQTALLNNKISERHARSLLNIPDKEEQKRLLEKIILNRMTVKQLDEEITILNGKESPIENETKEENINEIEMPTAKDIDEETPKTNNSNIFDRLRIDNIKPDNTIEPSKTLDETITLPDAKEPEPIISNIEETKITIPEVEVPNNSYNLEDSLINQQEIELPNTIKKKELHPQPEENIPSILDNQEETTLNSSNQINETSNLENSNQNYNIPDYNNAYDLRFAINNVRQVIQNTKKFGFNIDMEEFDFENIYQIVIKIDKNH